MRAHSNENLLRARELLSGRVSSEAADDVETSDGVGSSLEQLRAWSGVTKPRFVRVWIQGGIVALVCAGTAALTASAWMLLLSPLGLLLSYLRLRRMAFKRAEAFEQDYTAFLLSLASAVRTGADPMAAFVQAHQLFEGQSVMGRELEAVKYAVERGVREERVIRQFAASILHPDVVLFRTAMVLARREGSSLSECLQRLARVTRQRQSFRRKIRGATAMQRLSAFGILACAAAIGLLQFVTNPQGVMVALAHPIGKGAVLVGSVLLFGGVMLMINLTRSRI